MYSAFSDWQIHDIEKGRADCGVWGQSPQSGRRWSPWWGLGAKFAGKWRSRSGASRSQTVFLIRWPTLPPVLHMFKFDARVAAKSPDKWRGQPLRSSCIPQRTRSSDQLHREQAFKYADFLTRGTRTW